MKLDFDGLLFALSFALDCVEQDLLGVTTHHGKRVAALALHLNEMLDGLPAPEQRQTLAACAVLHDCALTEYIQDEYGGSYTALAKAGRMDPGPHCRMGEDMVAQLPFTAECAQGAVLYHHENVDGSGPFGKKGAEIPPAARLIQIADTVDARFDLSDPNRDKVDRVRAFLQEETGHLFAPAEAGALDALLAGGDLGWLHSDALDAHLHSLLPDGSMACTPEQLMQVAGVFARVTDYKSHFTRNHSVGIAEKAQTMARFYGADEELAAQLYFAGALHDIGKLVVDRAVLEKPDKLDDAEYRHIQSHAYYTYKILSAVPGLEDITRWASYHHEKLDGTGYPFGLTGDELDQWARMMACLDIYQALTEERSYKKKMPHRTAMAILEKLADSGKLDREIVGDVDRCFGPGETA